MLCRVVLCYVAAVCANNDMQFCYYLEHSFYLLLLKFRLFSGAGSSGSFPLTVAQSLYRDLEVRHPRCVGTVTKNIVYYTYSRTQLYFTY